MMKVVREPQRHDVRDIDVSVALEGDFETAYTSDDNSGVLPTDTMKNTIYALGKEHPVDTIESFALHLADHFGQVASVTSATVSVRAVQWTRAAVGGELHPHTFIGPNLGPGREAATCTATVSSGSRSIVSGLDELVLLKTTASGFAGFATDRFTTLRETEDRLMRTSVTATWTWQDADADFGAGRSAVRTALIEAFADHYSPSVQFTLNVMGQRALQACPGVEQIRLVMPNLHCLLVDLAPFGMTNDNEVFLPVEEPSGVIEATIARRGS